MQIHKINLSTKINEKLFHLAIGNFDGVHLGHQQIIKSVVNIAKKNNSPSAILSFNPHPRRFFAKELDRYQIISEKRKQELLNHLGIQHYFSLHFDNTIANLSPSDFIERIIIQQLHVDKLIIGYDFRFGKNRQGDINLLKSYSTIHGFSLEVIDPIYESSTNEIYSSTAIRLALSEGKIDKVNFMLGRSWTMEGCVIHGDKKAREMNFPTANLLPHDQVYPLKGVYAVKVFLENQFFNGIANFGERPTVDEKKLLLEVHLFDFNENIYGKHLTVEFLTFIRGEKKFASFELLKKQIIEDIKIVKKYHLGK